MGMTESEIMKALEWCEMFTDNIVLSNIKGDKFTSALQSLQTIKQVLKDYNRKNAEIERLEKEVDRLSQMVLYHDGEIADAQAEAIKEVVEKAKRKAFNLDFHRGMCVYVEELDQIAKEMGCGE